MGRFFIWECNAQGIPGYYKVIKRLQPLFEKLRSQQHVSGYFVNRICDQTTDNKETVRLSFFVPAKSISSAIKEVRKYLDENELIERSCIRECPHQDSISLKFRRFLALNTLIGLDIMKTDHPNARALLATYRFQISPARQPIRPHFEPTFQRGSVTYQSLSDDDKTFFWTNFSNCDEYGVWAHHLVNLVLGFDIPVYSFGEPYSISRVNKEILNPLNVPPIPEDWKPQVE